MILGAIFDFDNTLYDYETINKKSLYQLFNQLSIDHNLNLEDIQKIYTKINKNIKDSNNTNNKFNKIIYIKKILEILKIPLILLEKYYEIYQNEFNNNFILYDNVLNLFKTLKKNKVKIGICSNNIFIQQYDKLKKSKYIFFLNEDHFFNISIFKQLLKSD